MEVHYERNTTRRGNRGGRAKFFSFTAAVSPAETAADYRALRTGAKESPGGFPPRVNVHCERSISDFHKFQQCAQLTPAEKHPQVPSGYMIRGGGCILFRRTISQSAARKQIRIHFSFIRSPTFRLPMREESAHKFLLHIPLIITNHKTGPSVVLCIV